MATAQGARRGSRPLPPPPARRSRRPLLAVLAVVVLVVAVVVGVRVLGGSDAPTGDRPVTAEEAERLAVARFTTYTTGTAGFRMTVPSPTGDVTLDGLVDHRVHLGYARLSTAGRADDAATGLLQFGGTGVVFRPGAEVTLVQPPPEDGWTGRPLQEAGLSELDTALRLLLSLAADRPENPVLLQQNGARWLRADAVDGVAVDVMTGPAATPEGTAAQGQEVQQQDSRTRFWVDADGALLRVQARIGEGDELTTIDLTEAGGTVVPVGAITGGY